VIRTPRAARASGRALAMLALAAALAACGTRRTGGDGVAASETGASAAPAPAPAPAPAAPAAATFSAEYRRISKHPTCRDNRRVKIDANGNVFAAANQTECDKGQAWSTPYPSRPVRTLGEPERQRIAAVIRGSGFLGLASRSGDVDDGTIEEIDASIDGVNHTVRMDNATAPAFQQVRQALLGAAE
jgi:hypothetical protein